MEKFEKVCDWIVAIAFTAIGVGSIILLAKGKEPVDPFGWLCEES